MYRKTRMETMNSAIIGLDFFEIVYGFKKDREAKNARECENKCHHKGL